MSRQTVKGKSTPAFIIAHWERKTRRECAQEILRCWEQIERMQQKESHTVRELRDLVREHRQRADGNERRYKQRTQELALQDHRVRMVKTAGLWLRILAVFKGGRVLFEWRDS